MGNYPVISYIIRRILYVIPLLLAVSIVCFVIIQLPPGDFMTAIESQLKSQAGLSEQESRKMVDEMRKTYGLDKSMPVQYLIWIKNIVTRGDFGYSFGYRKPAQEVIWERLKWTMIIALSAHLISTLVGLLIGIYSATHQYSLGDHLSTFLAFIGLSFPEFFTALVIMYLLVFKFRAPHVGGLSSPEYVLAAWNWAKFVDFLQHLWIPVVISGVAGVARNMRVMRANLLDVFRSQYVITARAKGLKERIVLYKHAVVNALHPIIAYQGVALPYIVQGTMVTAIVLNLPTTGPAFYDALVFQDTLLAGSFLLMVTVVLVIGNLLSDLILAWIDPRIRYD